MVAKLIEAASERWRYVNGPHLVALVGAGARFEKGVLIERPDEAEKGRRVINQDTPSTILTIPLTRLLLRGTGHSESLD